MLQNDFAGVCVLLSRAVVVASLATRNIAEGVITMRATLAAVPWGRSA